MTFTYEAKKERLVLECKGRRETQPQILKRGGHRGKKVEVDEEAEEEILKVEEKMDVFIVKLRDST